MGSTALLANEQGREIDGSRLSYDAWGQARPVTGSNAYRSPVPGQTAPGIPGRPLGYTGHLNMDSLGLIHMGGRVYDPELGRMASPDPSVQFPLNSQGFNRYSYVNNNPLSYTDPSGYFTFGQLAKMVAIAFVSYYTAGWVTNAWMTAGTSSAAAGSGATATAVGGATAGTSAVATSSTTASLAAGGGATGTSAATVTLSGQMIGGATGGFVGGALYTGDLRGGLNGTFAGAVFGGIDFGYSGQWNLSRVAVQTLAGGAVAKIEGSDFQAGLKSAFVVSALNQAAYSMRKAMVTQSKLDPRNASGESAGIYDDHFKLAGTRFDPNYSDGRGLGFFGGAQGEHGYVFGALYNPGSFADRALEAYAGPHDFLSSPFYDASGNMLRLSTFGQALGGAASIINLVLATPFVVPVVAPSLVYQQALDN